MRTPQKLYKFHVANLQEIDRAMDKIALLINVAVSQNDKQTLSTFIRIYAFLLGAWAECRLRKLLYEPKGFSDSDRLVILNKSSQLDCWQKTIEVAFRKQYKIPKAKLTKDVLAHTAYFRFETLTEMLDKDLRSVIELRNKLAHGQWVYPLNNEGNDIAEEQKCALEHENILSLKFKINLIKSLSAIINDLVVSKPTFERDFDMHFNLIVETRRNLKNRKYQDWAKKMQEKYLRGKKYQKA